MRQEHNWIRRSCRKLPHLLGKHSSIEDSLVDDSIVAEIPALALCMKELVGIVDLANKLFASYYKLEPAETNINVTVNEDNSGALVLSNTLPPEYTPRSKFYHIETIWFREQIVLRGIKILKVDTHSLVI